MVSFKLKKKKHIPFYQCDYKFQLSSKKKFSFTDMASTPMIFIKMKNYVPSSSNTIILKNVLKTSRTRGNKVEDVKFPSMTRIPVCQLMIINRKTILIRISTRFGKAKETSGPSERLKVHFRYCPINYSA